MINLAKNYLQVDSLNGVQQISAEGKAPKNVVADYMQALFMHDFLLRSNDTRIKVHTTLHGMFDGNAPFSDAELKRLNLLTSSNKNYRDGEAVLNAYLIPFQNLTLRNENFFTFKTNYSQKKDADLILGRLATSVYQKSMGKTWLEKLKRTVDYSKRAYVKTGFGAFIWTQDSSYEGEFIESTRLLFPDETYLDEDQIPYFEVMHSVSPQELWKWHQDGSDAVYNKDAIVLALRRNVTSNTIGTSWGTEEVRAFQQKLKNNDSFLYNNMRARINLISLYAQEYDGTVSRYIFTRYGWESYSNKIKSGGMSAKDISEVDGFIYKKENQKITMKDVIKIFTLSPGGLYIHEEKGLGHTVFPYVQDITRMRNHVADEEARSSTALFQSSAGRSKDVQQHRFIHGGMVDVSDLTLVENTFGANIQVSISTIKFCQADMLNAINLNGLNPYLTPNDGQQRNANEIDNFNSKEHKNQRNMFEYYYDQSDAWGLKVIARSLKDDGKFRDELLKESKRVGLPKDFWDIEKSNVGDNGLPKHMYACVTRAKGFGSAEAFERQMVKLGTVASSFGERGRQNFKDDMIESIAGYDAVDRYNPQADRLALPTEDDTIAGLENSTMGDDLEWQDTFSVDNNHAVHAISHMQKATSMIQAYESHQLQAMPLSLDPETALDSALQKLVLYLQNFQPHELQHLQELRKDVTVKSLLQQLSQQWYELAGKIDFFSNQAKQNQEKEQNRLQKKSFEIAKNAQENDPKTQEIYLKNQRDIMKLQGTLQIMAQRDQARFALQAQSQKFSQDIQSAKVSADIELGKMKTKADNAVSISKSAVDIGVRKVEAISNLQSKNQPT